MHGDDDPYGSVHRVELFDQFPHRVTLANDVSVMNRAATEDVRSPVWPVVSQVLHGGPAPSPLAARLVTCSTTGCARDAPVLDADNSGEYDEAGPTVMDALWDPIADAVMRPGVRGPDLRSRQHPRARQPLRRVVRRQGPAHAPEPTGARASSTCATAARDRSTRAERRSGRSWIRSAPALAASQGPDPTLWRSPARRTGFTPGVIPDTFRATNRPTFQQVLELTSPPFGRGR